ncbi:translation factor Sua5, partial [Actinomyces sp. MRS3W]|nr:translation factor Sua5 [Actinomyces sp. MRS3W]
ADAGAVPGPQVPTDILLLDGGATPGPVASTIVSLAGRAAQAPTVVRDGVITRTQLAAVVPLAPAAEEGGA